VVRLWEEIEHFQGIEPVALLEQEPEIAGQGRRATGDVVEAFGTERHKQLERRNADAHGRRIYCLSCMRPTNPRNPAVRDYRILSLTCPGFSTVCG
jgi:hypothetical protein